VAHIISALAIAPEQIFTRMYGRMLKLLRSARAHHVVAMPLFVFRDATPAATYSIPQALLSDFAVFGAQDLVQLVHLPSRRRRRASKHGTGRVVAGWWLSMHKGEMIWPWWYSPEVGWEGRWVGELGP
jgi:hypothetical protein